MTSEIQDLGKNDSSFSSSNSDESDSENSEYSTDGYDIDSIENRSLEIRSTLSELEEQYFYLREMVFCEKALLLERKYDGIRAGTAVEFIGQLQKLQENMRDGVQLASARRDFRLACVQVTVEAENLAAQQTVKNDKGILTDQIQTQIEEKMSILEQDRNNDFNTELKKHQIKKAVALGNIGGNIGFGIGTSTGGNSIIRGGNIMDPHHHSISTISCDGLGGYCGSTTFTNFGSGNCSNSNNGLTGEKVVVTGPYIVYMLHEVDIIEDLLAIKKASAIPRRKPFLESVLAY